MTHEPTRFPADSAFVIHFAHPHPGADPRPGRVEHVASGRARRVEDEAQLMTFVAEVLASLEVTSAPAAPQRAR
jgi:hypothetical protein